MKPLDLYINKDGQKLRCGYTTGSCATAASKAAAQMLITGQVIDEITIETPSGIDLTLEIENVKFEDDSVSCSVRKDAGDDPDSTDGIEIYSRVKLNDNDDIHIDGGFGVGRITKKGIYGEIGDAAINPVPKNMIEKELRMVSKRGFDVEIFVPDGLEISKKTFNKNIGITGGISIIGTKGIVYPMSEEALVKTIYMEIDSIGKNVGIDTEIILTPGNYGEKYTALYTDSKEMVKVSNFIGKALKYAYNAGFRRFLLIGHVGKFAKLSLGAFQTHNEVVDLRMEAFVYYLALEGADLEILNHVNSLLTAEEATKYIIDSGYGFVIGKMERGAEERIKRYLKDDDVSIKVKMYSMDRGVDI